MAGFVVHGIPGSPFVRAVLATLEEKGAPYRLAALAPGSHRAEPYTLMNPFARIPTLEHDGFILYETSAILRYLDRVLPTPAMTPKDVKQAARMDQIMSISDWYLFQGVGNVIGFQRIVGPRLMGLTPDEAAIEAAMPAAHRVIDALNGLLGNQTYLAGESVSLADIMVCCQVDFLEQCPEWAELTAANPQLPAWLKRMQSRPAFQATTWENVAKMAAA